MSPHQADPKATLSPRINRLLQEALSIAEERDSVPEEKRTHEQELESVKRLDTLMELIINCRQAAEGPIVYIDHPERQYLENTTVDGAVQTALEDEYPTPEDFPDYVEIANYRKMLPSTHDNTYPSIHSPLENLLEQLDEEHQNPEDTTSTKPTGRMITAERHFIQAILAEYSPYWCEATHTFQASVRQWLRRNYQNDPDWQPIRSYQKSICGHCYRVRGTQEMRTCTACNRRGCSVCWREATRDPLNWPRTGRRQGTCGFRLSDQQEQQKRINTYNLHALQKGWAYENAGPIHAE